MEQNINVTPTKNSNVVFISHPTNAIKMMKTNMNFIFNPTVNTKIMKTKQFLQKFAIGFTPINNKVDQIFIIPNSVLHIFVFCWRDRGKYGY